MTVIGETNPFVSVGAQPEQAFKSEIPPDKTWQSISKEKAESETLKGGQYKDVFGALQGRNIVFCLDCSGSMYEHLPIIIHQLYEVRLCTCFCFFCFVLVCLYVLKSVCFSVCMSLC